MKLAMKGTAAACFLALGSMSANAKLIDHGTYTTDTVSGLDWLDVTATVSRPSQDISQLFDSGEEFAGWRYATEIEFYTLVSNASDTRITPNEHFASPLPEVNRHSAAEDLIALLGNTVDAMYLELYGITYDSYHGYPEGEYLDRTGGIIMNSFTRGEKLAYIVDDDSTIWSPDDPQDRVVTGFDSYYFCLDGEYCEPGSYLVRPTSVPEPSTLALLGLGIMGLGFARKQKTS